MPTIQTCPRCGSTGPFRSEAAQLCVECTEKSKADRKVNMRLYHRARSRAVAELVSKYHDEFMANLDVQLVEVKKEEATNVKQG